MRALIFCFSMKSLTNENLGAELRVVRMLRVFGTGSVEITASMKNPRRLGSMQPVDKSFFRWFGGNAMTYLYVANDGDLTTMRSCCNEGRGERSGRG